MPEHACAEIKAMKIRCEELIVTGNERGAIEYYLSDNADDSKYLSAQFYDDNAACV